MQDILFWLKKNIKDIIVGILLIIIIILILYDHFTEEEAPIIDNSLALVDKDQEETKEENKVEEVSTLKVDIKGAVKNPGVYEFASGSIVNDVVLLAGGFNSNAYKNGINLSKKIKDEMVIYVYTKSEINAAKKENETKETETVCEVPSYNICECVDNQESIIETNENKTPSDTSNVDDNSTTPSKGLVNINTASVTELTTLSGIGESKAEAIIKYRTENGNFKTIEDLLNVSGIGEALFAKVKDSITV